MLKVIVLIPDDRAGLPTFPGIPMPTPTEKFVLTECEGCDRPSWIGPSQAELLASGRMADGRALCLHCFIPLLESREHDRIGVKLEPRYGRDGGAN